MRWRPAGVVTSHHAGELRRSSFKLFLSHAQAEAQNQVSLLSELLAKAGVTAWFDMDAEQLEGRDMVRGIWNSDVFVLYLTASYFTRWFCRLESEVALKLGKRLLVVFEADARHGGAVDHVELCVCG